MHSIFGPADRGTFVQAMRTAFSNCWTRPCTVEDDGERWRRAVGDGEVDIAVAVQVADDGRQEIRPVAVAHQDRHGVATVGCREIDLAVAVEVADHDASGSDPAGGTVVAGAVSELERRDTQS
jgi:hypothetical protein